MKKRIFKLVPFLCTIFILFQSILIMPTLNADAVNANESSTKDALVKTGRIVENIDDNWSFHKGDQGTKENFGVVKFNDNGWDKVSLPHTWNAEDGADGGNDYYKGDGWYRKVLNVPERYKGKALFLQFGAANKEAEVFINGKSVYTHMGGYTAFTVDITADVNYGKNNIVAVRVNNEVNDAIPLSGDFTFYGGLYRSVNLLVTDKTHIDVQDDGSSGVYVTIPNVESIKKKAEVTVKVPVKLDKEDYGSKSNLVTVKAVIKDAAGKKIESVELKSDGKQLQSAKVSEGSTVFTGTMKVKKPHLWNGLKDPYLYTVEVTVARKGEVIDQVMEKAGFRYYSVDPDKGFFLNGESYPLRGVDIHQDRKGYGNAVPDEVREEDLKLIKEIGANTMRAAHYPHSQFVYDRADEMGLVVWAEIPFVNHMTTSMEFADNAEKQLTEMIKQNYNHPSIVTWGLQNELGGFGGYIKDSNLSQKKQYAKATELMKRLAAKAKELDPERLVTQAILGVPAIPELQINQNVMNQQLDWASNKVVKGSEIDKFIDLSSVNVYYGWYTPNVHDLDGALTAIHKNYPYAILGISEYGAGANPSQHQIIRDDFEWDGYEDSIDQWHPEEYQNYIHEISYFIIKKHPELWATHIWNIFDFGSDSRNEGGNPGINDKGLVTYDRQTKKDAFYFYKAQWNKVDPFVYITSRRYTERRESITPIKVYSNLNEVTLTVNGKDYGKGRLQQTGVFVWDNVELKTSDNVVVASAKKADGANITDSVTNWTVTTQPVSNNEASVKYHIQ